MNNRTCLAVALALAGCLANAGPALAQSCIANNLGTIHPAPQYPMPGGDPGGTTIITCLPPMPVTGGTAMDAYWRGQRQALENERLQLQIQNERNIQELERQCAAALAAGRPAPGRPCMQLKAMGLGPFADR
jgi:hypothetical protein